MIMRDNFLDDYLRIASDCTDSPEVFHQWLSLVVAGVCIGRRRWIQFGSKKIYPNFFITLIGASGAARKSTSLNISKSLLKKTIPEGILPNEFSHEELTKILRDNPCGTFYHDEFRSLIGLLNKDYMGSTKSFLAEAWDCPDYYTRQTKSDGKIEIIDMCPSLVSATTMDWFLKGLTESDIDGGFLNRFLFVIGKKTKSLGWPPSMDYASYYKLSNRLSLLTKIIPTELIVSNELKQQQTLWAAQLAKRIDGISYYSLFARLNIYALKIALVLATLSGDDCLQPIQLATAQDMIDTLSNDLRDMCNNNISFSKADADGQKIIEFLHSSGGSATKRDIMRKRHLTSRDYKLIMDTLIDCEQVTIDPRTGAATVTTQTICDKDSI